MKRLGLDLGTKHIVLSWRDENNNIKSKYEVNGYYAIERPDAFTEQLLVKQAIPYVPMGEGANKRLIAIGARAEKLAYAFNKTLKRPMCDGAVSKSDDDAQDIIAVIIKSMIGRLAEDATIYYCTTAKAINSDNLNVDFHRKIVKMIIENYASDKVNVKAYHINEARCLILHELGEAIGISWGAGTVTVHAGVFGVPIFEFCIVGSGDWVDLEVAKRFGYDPLKPGADAVENPTSVCRRKESLSLKSMPDDKVGQAIYLFYEMLIENVVNGLMKGFDEYKSKFKFDKPIPVINAGGTCMPDGFMELFKKKLDEVKSSSAIPIGEVTKADNPLFAVSIGCLHAAELHETPK